MASVCLILSDHCAKVAYESSGERPLAAKYENVDAVFDAVIF